MKIPFKLTFTLLEMDTISTVIIIYEHYLHIEYTDTCY